MKINIYAIIMRCSRKKYHWTLTIPSDFQASFRNRQILKSCLRSPKLITKDKRPTRSKSYCCHLHPKNLSRYRNSDCWSQWMKTFYNALDLNMLCQWSTLSLTRFNVRRQAITWLFARMTKHLNSKNYLVIRSLIAQKAINNLPRDLLLSKEKSLLLINFNRLKLR